MPFGPTKKSKLSKKAAAPVKKVAKPAPKKGKK